MDYSVDTKHNHHYLYMKEAEEVYYRGEGSVTMASRVEEGIMGQEMGDVSLEARKARKQILLLSSPESVGLVDTLVFSQFNGFILNFWPPELSVNTVLFLQGNRGGDNLSLAIEN